ncbi:transmembrane and death domain protein 1-like isoform X2 [Girardinichthys multiradiatus]|uniref:transmembrane and death domain protein 1-like isoform X2 n=1 Tax=Girardinichthys multiradiatus TaxID=208333 RepID=UPI001FACCF76|nr:transmembrane and death domain protein 1-like isoform X2 [Girardinichthys multiradiatus]
MNVCKICVCFFFLLQSPTREEETVAEDIGIHQLERLVEQLTSKECEDLLLALSRPEEDIFRHIDRLSPENNQLDLKFRAKRDTSSAADQKSQCRTALTDWLLVFGQNIYYNRLSRALQHIGRTDIALEVGKNINQDKTLRLKRYVEDYQKHVNSLGVQFMKADANKHQLPHQRVRKIKLGDLTWRDLDLIVKRAPVPPYPRGPLDVALPLLYGILLCSVSCATLLLIIVLVSKGSS